MDPLLNSPTPSEPPLCLRPARRLLRRLYTSNPFYVISALLVFVGLRMSLDTSGTTFETWGLMVALAGYTLLLATTACLLIRLGRIWDDLRTVVLLVVVMFLALSVTFDETLTGNPRLGVACNLVGLLFAVLVSETVLRVIRLGLPSLFRVPYYLILTLFFLYPAALVPLLGDPARPALQWALFGFASLAGLVFLSLLPAIRQGPAYAGKNGSPWAFPWYPWVLFGLLALAVCGRAFYLCISLHFVERTSYHFIERAHSIFGLYFLVPFLFMLDVLALELGMVTRHRGVIRTAMAVPLALVGMSLVGPEGDQVYQDFLLLFRGQLGCSPLFLALIAATSFYALALVRRVPEALGALTLSLLALTIVGPSTLNLDGLSLSSPRPQPLLALGVLQLWLGWGGRQSVRCLCGAVCLVAGLTLSLGKIDSVAFEGLIAFHLGLAAILALGALFDDRLGRFLRLAGAVLLTGASLLAVPGDPWICKLAFFSPEFVRVYPMILVVVATTYGFLFGSRAHLYAATLSVAGWVALVALRGYLQARLLVAGLDRIAWGMAFFLLATLISLAKAGLLRRWLEREPALQRVTETISQTGSSRRRP
jgi:hypothetical protein